MDEKRITLEINGKLIRVVPSMVKELLKFGASTTPRAVKEPPKELLTMPLPKKLILPRTEPDKPTVETKAEPLKVEPLPPDPVTAPIITKPIKVVAKKKQAKKTKK